MRLFKQYVFNSRYAEPPNESSLPWWARKEGKDDQFSVVAWIERTERKRITHRKKSGKRVGGRGFSFGAGETHELEQDDVTTFWPDATNIAEVAHMHDVPTVMDVPPDGEDGVWQSHEDVDIKRKKR